jgi:hypothetical protein
MYGASNLELQTATDETLNVLTIQFAEFRTKAIATSKELGKKMQDLRKHVDKVETVRHLWKNGLWDWVLNKTKYSGPLLLWEKILIRLEIG